MYANHQGLWATCSTCGRALAQWQRACPSCSLRSPTVARGMAPGSTPGLHPLVKVGVAILLWKALQALSDEDFGDGEFPRRFRDEFREEHIERHGSYCPACDSTVPFENLSVDHIVPMSRGGRTSRANAAILCRRCNSRKGNSMSMLDLLRGRR